MQGEGPSLTGGVMRRIALLVFAAASLACASSGSTRTWYKPGASGSDLEAARSQCIADAVQGMKDGPDQTAGARGGSDFVSCMQRRGWRQVEKAPVK